MTICFSALAIAAALLAPSAVCAEPAQTPAPHQTLGPLVQSMIDRNALADQVALNKWDSHGAVFVPTRETQLLDAVRRKAPAYQLTADDAARFQLGQMEANRLIQYQLLDDWYYRGKAPETHRTPLADLRSRLDTLQDSQLKALANISSLRQTPACSALVAHEVKRAAYQHRLDAVHHLALVRSVGDICSSP